MSAGRVRRVPAVWRSVMPLAIFTYALVLSSGALLHHDLSCEVKSRTHCTSCVAGISGPGLAADTAPLAEQARETDATPAGCDVPAGLSSFHSVQDRAPPAA